MPVRDAQQLGARPALLAQAALVGRERPAASTLDRIRRGGRASSPHCRAQYGQWVSVTGLTRRPCAMSEFGRQVEQPGDREADHVEHREHHERALGRVDRVATQGELNVIGIRNPPRAPTAPTMPSTADASLVDFASAPCAARRARRRRPARRTSSRSPGSSGTSTRCRCRSRRRPTGTRPGTTGTRRSCGRRRATGRGVPERRRIRQRAAPAGARHGVERASESDRIVPTIIPTNAPRVTFAPPYLSASQPPNGRVSEPTKRAEEGVEGEVDADAEAVGIG